MSSQGERWKHLHNVQFSNTSSGYVTIFIEKALLFTGGEALLLIGGEVTIFFNDREPNLS